MSMAHCADFDDFDDFDAHAHLFVPDAQAGRVTLGEVSSPVGVLRRGDCVELVSTEKYPYAAVITNIFLEGAAKTPTLTVRWFYRLTDFQHPPAGQFAANALFLSEFKDDNQVSKVSRRIVVHKPRINAAEDVTWLPVRLGGCPASQLVAEGWYTCSHWYGPSNEERRTGIPVVAPLRRDDLIFSTATEPQTASPKEPARTGEASPPSSSSSGAAAATAQDHGSSRSHRARTPASTSTTTSSGSSSSSSSGKSGPAQKADSQMRTRSRVKLSSSSSESSSSESDEAEEDGKGRKGRHSEKEIELTPSGRPRRSSAPRQDYAWNALGLNKPSEDDEAEKKESLASSRTGRLQKKRTILKEEVMDEEKEGEAEEDKEAKEERKPTPKPSHKKKVPEIKRSASSSSSSSASSPSPSASSASLASRSGAAKKKRRAHKSDSEGDDDAVAPRKRREDSSSSTADAAMQIDKPNGVLASSTPPSTAGGSTRKASADDATQTVPTREPSPAGPAESHDEASRQLPPPIRRTFALLSVGGFSVPGITSTYSTRLLAMATALASRGVLAAPANGDSSRGSTELLVQTAAATADPLHARRIESRDDSGAATGGGAAEKATEEDDDDDEYVIDDMPRSTRMTVEQRPQGEQREGETNLGGEQSPRAAGKGRPKRRAQNLGTLADHFTESRRAGDVDFDRARSMIRRLSHLSLISKPTRQAIHHLLFEPIPRHRIATAEWIFGELVNLRADADENDLAELGELVANALLSR